MFKKLWAFLAIFVCVFTFSFVYAETKKETKTNDINEHSRKLLDIGTYSKVYKMSEEADVSLPFMRVFDNKSFYDKDVAKTGLSIGSKELSISGKMSGVQNILCTDSVTIDGSVEYAYIIASNVVIKGTVEKDIVILAQSVFVTEEANILGDIVLLSVKTEIRGNVQGNLIINSDNTLLKAAVGKDCRVSSRELNIDNLDVGGEIYIETDSETNILEKYPNATIKAYTTQTNKSVVKQNTFINLDEAINIILKIVVYSLVYALIIKMWPKLFENLTIKIKGHPTFTVLMGVLMIVTIPIVLTLLFLLAYVGLGMIAGPVFVAYSAIIILAISLAKFISGVFLLEFIKNNFVKGERKIFREAGIFALVLLLIYIICKISFIGGYATMATMLFSVGGIFTGMMKKLGVKSK